jgi:hypothetical protein
VTALIAVAPIARTPRHIAFGFVVAFLIAFAFTFSNVSA